MSVAEAAKYLKISYQAVYVAILNKKMAAFKDGGKWYIENKEVDGYAKRRYDRRFSTFNGKLKFDPEKGEMTPTDVSKKLNVSVHHIYYLLRNKKLKAFRKGSCYVVLMKDIEEAKKILNINRKVVVPVSSYDRTEGDGDSGSMGGP